MPTLIAILIMRALEKYSNKPFTKVWIKFLLNTLTNVDKYNKLFQNSDASTIYKLHAASERLLKTFLAFFVKSEVIRDHATDLTNVDFLNPSLFLPNKELFLGDDTSALLLHLKESLLMHFILV